MFFYKKLFRCEIQLYQFSKSSLKRQIMDILNIKQKNNYLNLILTYTNYELVLTFDTPLILYFH